MSLERAFLADIADHPDDDTPRLAYADWLMEQPDPVRAARGEFMATQLSLARDTQRLGPRTQWKNRRRELLRRHAGAWLGAGRGVLAEYMYDRGFLDMATLSGTCDETRTVAILPVEGFQAGCRELFRNEPFVRTVRLAPRTWLQEPNLDFLVALLAVPELPRLVKLSLEECELSDDACHAIAQAERVAGLQKLLLGGNSFSATGIAALSSSSRLADLEALSLYRCNLATDAVEAIAAARYLRNLKYLCLDGNRVGESGLERLGRSQALPSLTTLSLENALDASRELAVFLQGPLVRQLRQLELSNNEALFLEAAHLIASCERLSALEVLRLNYVGVHDGGYTALAESRHLGNLRELSLMNCLYFGDHGGHLFFSSRLRSLEKLNLRGCIPEGGLEICLSRAQLPALRALALSWDLHLVPADATALVLSSLIRRLHSLHLEIPILTAQAAEILLSLAHAEGPGELCLMAGGQDWNRKQFSEAFGSRLHLGSRKF